MLSCRPDQTRLNDQDDQEDQDDQDDQDNQDDQDDQDDQLEAVRQDLLPLTCVLIAWFLMARIRGSANISTGL